MAGKPRYQQIQPFFGGINADRLFVLLVSGVQNGFQFSAPALVPWQQ